MSATFHATALQAIGLRFSVFMANDAKAIANRLRQRDPELLDSLIEQYQYRLFQYLLHLSGDRQLAEDFFQETWVRVLERGHQYDGKWKFEAWLFAIARILKFDWHRRKKSQSLDALSGPDDSPFDVEDERRDTPLQELLSSARLSGVNATLGKHPAAYREVLLLRFQEELQLEEIAAVLGTPLSTVKSRLYRGLEAMRAALSPGAAATEGAS